MSKGSNNSSLGKARNKKEDEFYTQLSDIEVELKNYKKHLEWMKKISMVNGDLK